MNELDISVRLTKVYIILLQILQKYHCDLMKTYSKYDINVVIRNFVKIGDRVQEWFRHNANTIQRYKT
jgi:hypothetical protein